MFSLLLYLQSSSSNWKSRERITEFKVCASMMCLVAKKRESRAVRGIERERKEWENRWFSCIAVRRQMYISSILIVAVVNVIWVWVCKSKKNKKLNSLCYQRFGANDRESSSNSLFYLFLFPFPSLQWCTDVNFTRTLPMRLVWKPKTTFTSVFLFILFLILSLLHAFTRFFSLPLRLSQLCFNTHGNSCFLPRQDPLLFLSPVTTQTR